MAGGWASRWPASIVSAVQISGHCGMACRRCKVLVTVQWMVTPPRSPAASAWVSRGSRAVAQLVAGAQVRAERGELGAAQDVAGTAALVVKAGGVGREAARTSRHGEPAQPAHGGSSVAAGHDLDGMR
jgi:hypothetical protein